MRKLVAVYPAIAMANGKVITMQSSMEMDDGEEVVDAIARYKDEPFRFADSDGPMMNPKAAVLFQVIDSDLQENDDAGNDSKETETGGENTGSRQEYPH